MRRQYLHLAAYRCDRCGGPVVAGSYAVRESEISKETDIRQVGAVCLECGQVQTHVTESGITHHFPPVEWDASAAARKVHTLLDD